MKTKDILLHQGLVGIVFVLWGILWLALYYENTFGKALSGFFIILGIGFIFLYVSIGVLATLLGLRLINEIIFTALMGPVIAVASVLYVLLFYRYEKGVNEDEN